MTVQARPLRDRPLDVFWLAFFAINLVVLLATDLSTLYPASIKPKWTTELRTYYFETYRDQFALNPPDWFKAYIWLEAVYQAPASLWLLWGIFKDHPLVPVHTLLYGLQTALTTFTCMVDIQSWIIIRQAEKTKLMWLYGPYLAIAVFMMFDGYFRLQKELLGSRSPASGKAKAVEDRKRR